MNYLNILKVIRGLNKDPKIKSILDSINKDQLDNKKWLIEESEKYFYFQLTITSNISKSNPNLQ